MVESLQKHIRDNHGANSSVSKLSAMSGYSPVHLSRLFFRYTGMRIHEYVNRCRQEHYNHMLIAGRLRKEIAFELGFSSTSALYHWSKKLPPSQEAP